MAASAKGRAAPDAGAVDPSRATVIVATYRQPEWLDRCLRGLAVQSTAGFRVLVTEDAAGSETAEVVERLRSETELRIGHLWQADRGHRKTRALNRAIRRADGDYLVFLDGDCVPRDDFVATHLELAESDRFLSGGALELPPGLSAAIAPRDIATGRAFRAGWLRDRGWRPGRRILRTLRFRPAARLLDVLTPTSPTFNGGNSSVWRRDAVRVNGFDLPMGYGGQDRAFGERLENLGVRGKQVRHRAVCLHLHHRRPYRSEEGIRENERIRRRIRDSGRVRARRGLGEVRPEETDGEEGA